MLMKIYFTGIVSYFTDDEVEEMRTLWREAMVAAINLDEPEQLNKLHQKLRTYGDKRRGSMAEIIKRGGVPLSVVGFIVAVAALVGQNINPLTQSLTIVSMATFVLGTIVLLLTNSPKLKVWRAKSDLKPHGTVLLQSLVKDLKLKASKDRNDKYMVGFDAYLASAFVCRKRDMITLVERRALSVATFLYIVGMSCELVAYLVH